MVRQHNTSEKLTRLVKLERMEAKMYWLARVLRQWKALLFVEFCCLLIISIERKFYTSIVLNLLS